MKSKIVKGLVFVAVILLVLLFSIIYRLNFNVLYTNHKQIDIPLGQEFENNDIINILKEVVGNRKFNVQKLEVYEDMISISINEISDEELENLNSKINEKYGTENTIDDMKITDLPRVKFGDYIGSYLMPLIISGILIVIYIGIYIFIDKKNK